MSDPKAGKPVAERFDVRRAVAVAIVLLAVVLAVVKRARDGAAEKEEAQNQPTPSDGKTFLQEPLEPEESSGGVSWALLGNEGFLGAAEPPSDPWATEPPPLVVEKVEASPFEDFRREEPMDPEESRRSAVMAAVRGGSMFGGGRARSSSQGRSAQLLDSTAGDLQATEQMLARELDRMQGDLQKMLEGGESGRGQGSLPAFGGSSVGGGPSRFLSGAETNRNGPVEISRGRWIDPRAIPAGREIAAVTATALNSERPGALVAMVRHDVRSLAGDLVIPKGSSLHSDLDQQVSAGENRAVVAFTRLDIPTDRGRVSFQLVGFPSSDRLGASGVRGRVHSKFGQKFGAAVALALIGAGLQVAAGEPAFDGEPSLGDAARLGVANSLSQVSSEVLRQYMSIRPTLSLPVGTPLKIVLNRDLLLKPP